jgi:nucleotide-binding universal stress UspA family protein
MTAHGAAPVVAYIDGTDEAKCAADYAAWEALRRRVGLRVVYARGPTPYWGPAIPLLDEYFWEQEWVRTLLAKTTAEMQDAHPGLAIEAAAVRGRPSGVLVDESKRSTLVVVGTRATSGLGGHRSASVAVQVAGHASCPVVAVPEVPGRRCDASTFADRPVMVGIDGSEHSQAAVTYAAREAIDRGVELRAVLVWSVFDIDDPREFSASEPSEGAEQQRSDRVLSEAFVGWQDQFPDLLLTRTAIHDIDPVSVLVDLSAEAGLVVIGSRGTGGFFGLPIGSTVDGLIRNAHAPVVVVHPGDVHAIGLYSSDG